MANNSMQAQRNLNGYQQLDFWAKHYEELSKKYPFVRANLQTVCA
jgi:hypothetical protein